MVRLTGALKELQQERDRAARDVKRLEEAIAVLGKLVALNGARPSGRAESKRRVMSAAARRRIAAAQKERWARWKAEQKKKAA